MAAEMGSWRRNTTTGASIGWRLLTGAVFGIIGSVVMGMFAMVVALMMQGDFWMPLKGIAATFLGEAAMQPGFAAGPILVGAIFHMMNGAWLGALFGLITPRLSLTWSIVAGLVFGFVEALGALWVVVPLVNPVMAKMISLDAPWIIEHLLFGLVLGLYPLARDWGWFGGSQPDHIV